MFDNEKKEIYHYKLRMKKKLYFNVDTMWGVFSFEFANREDLAKSGVDVHPVYGNFVISGDATELREGEVRDVIFTDHMDDKYGKGYQFVEILSEGLKTPEAQAEFLRQMINSNKHYKEIVETYPPTETYIEDLIAGKYDLKVIKGIQEATEQRYLESLSEHREYQEAIIKLAPIGAGITTVKKLVKHFKGGENVVKILENDIYRVTEVDSFGFRRVDELALKLGYDMESTERLVAGAAYVLEQMSDNGDVKIPIEDFDAEMCKILEIPEVTDELFNSIMEDPRFTYSDGIICLEKLRKEEFYLAKKIVELATNVKHLEGLEENKEAIIEKNESVNGFKFNEQQRGLIESALKQGVTILTGYAGTGKTSSVKTIVEIYRAAGYEPIAMALSGKAAQVMTENGIQNAGTIHRQLVYKDGYFTFNHFEKLPNQLIVVDEASMINNSLFKNIVDAIEVGHRLLIIGDNAQLPPIGHGAVFDTLLSVDLPNSKLTEIHRQAAKSGIITVATDVRNGNQINEYGSKETQIVGELKDMRVFNYIDKTLISRDITTTIKQYLKNPAMNPKDLQVITAMKRGGLGVPTLNKELQDIINPHPRSKKLDFHLIKGQELRVGDRVIQNGNLYKADGFYSLESYKNGLRHNTEVFNGTIGYIEKYEEHGLLVRFDGYTGTEYVFYAKEGEQGKKPIGMLDLAYAITTHRSQGSGFKTVIFTFDYSAYMLLSKEFVYTGITRAIDNCLMFVENTALHHAIKQSHSNNRLTFLREFLEAELEKSGVVA